MAPTQASPPKTRPCFRWNLIDCFFILYAKILPAGFLPPHTWRQTDNYSIILRFYEGNANPLTPKIYNLLSEDGLGGGENPFFYYLIAQLFHITGPSLLLLRLIWLGIVFGGLMSLFWLSHRLTGSVLGAFAIPLLILLNPSFNFYSSAIIANPIAWSFNVVGLSMLLVAIDRFREGRQSLTWWLLWGLTTLFAGWLKVTELIPFSLIIGMVVLQAGSRKFLGKELVPLFNAAWNWRFAAGAAGIVLGVAAWYAYIIHLNQSVGNDYFSTQTKPLWSLSEKRIQEALQMISTIWWRLFYFPPYYLAMPLVAGILIGQQKAVSPLVKAINLLAPLAILVYLLLWFLALVHDEYYVIETLFWQVFLFIGLFQVWEAQPRLPTAYQYGFWALLGILIISGVFYARTTFDYRYNMWSHELPNAVLHKDSFQDKLSEWGVGKDAVVLSLPDPMPNKSLSGIRRRGYTAFNLGETPVCDFLRSHPGVDYVVIAEQGLRDQLSEQAPCLAQPVGVHKGVAVYEVPLKGR